MLGSTDGTTDESKDSELSVDTSETFDSVRSGKSDMALTAGFLYGSTCID